ncbi:MAG: SDR family NAD(P)-dependent oxidoreductase [Candidatus Vecturithrix sp.]|nr:SDR family NAD(P)-dependent oxidoreductase [Candidatus Vecturithrix sp.]
MKNFYETYFGLQNKRAVVTGAGRGIGRAVAEAFAAVGAEVLVHYHSSEKSAQEVVETIQANGGNAWAAKADLTNSAQVKALFQQVEERWGALDILVNNAGDLLQRSTIENFSDELLDRVVKLNIYTAIYASREAIPLLKKGKRASIVSVGSIAGHNGGLNGATVYAATKGAIHTFTRGLAKELAPQIRVNAIAPGVIMTDFHRRHSTEQSLEVIAGNTPLKRLGQAEDMAAAVVFLCSEGAAFMTGEILELNGGLWFA